MREDDAAIDATVPRPVRRTSRDERRLVVMLAVAGGVAWWIVPKGRPTDPSTGASSRGELSTRPTVAVMPFENLSGDPTQDYFSDGLTEDIINALGRYQIGRAHV